MNAYVTVIFVMLINIVVSRDFYVGMFKKNDLLVAQDRLYKEKMSYRYTYAKYGRIFNCKITYFRVADRLGYGPGPKTQIVRGGLGKKYLVLHLTSPYNMPISVNIYVGCPNMFKSTKADTRTSPEVIATTDTTASGDQKTDMTTVAGTAGNSIGRETTATAVATT